MAVAARHNLADRRGLLPGAPGHVRRAGPSAAFGAAAAYSFYPTKNLGALGDGGALTTARRARSPRARGGCATADRPIAIITASSA